MADASLSSLQSQLKEKIEGGEFDSVINVKNLVQAGHEICLAAQKFMCSRISQAAWFAHLEVRISEEVLTEELVETVEDVLEISEGVLCVAMPPVAAECECVSAAISVTTNLAKWVLQFMEDEAMKRHLKDSDEARRMYIVALSNFTAECRNISKRLDTDEKTSLRFSLFLMQLARQFEGNEQLADTDSDWILKFLTCEESMQIICQQFKKDMDFKESMCGLVEWGTKNLTSVPSFQVEVSEILETTQDLATVGEHFDLVGEVPGTVVSVLQALNGDPMALGELAEKGMSGAVETVAKQCMGFLQIELAAQDLYTKWVTKDGEQSEQKEEVHAKLEEVKTNVETLIKAVKFWEIYSVPEVAVNEKAIAEYNAAMGLNSPFQQMIDQGKKARGADVSQPYRFGDFSRGVIATGKTSRGAHADDLYKFGDFSRGLVKAFGS